MKAKSGQHNLYGKLNWVHTWYEFTPTGALDVRERTVLDQGGSPGLQIGVSGGSDG